MRIGIIVDNEFYDDVRVNNECDILSQHHEVFVLCLNFGTALTKDLSFKVQSIHIKRRHKDILFALSNSCDLYTHFWAYHIKKFIVQHQLEAIHVHDLYLSKAAKLATEKSNIPFTLDLHENFPTVVAGYKWMHKFPHRLLIRPQKWKKKEKKYLQYAHRIIVLSDHFKNQLAERYPSLDKSKFVVFPNIPNLSKLLSYPIDMQILKDKKHDDDFVLFYFGLISKRRGLNVVFDAIQQLVKSNPSLKLLLVGPIDKNERADFMVRINSEELKKHILYYEWMDISHLPSLISVSDLCLSPIEKNEHHESGVANKVYQYMVFGKALLVSDCKPQADLVASSGAGMVHKWDDSKDLAQKIEAVYSDKDQLIGMGVNARRSIFKLIKDSPYAKDLLAIYEPKN